MVFGLFSLFNARKMLRKGIETGIIYKQQSIAEYFPKKYFSVDQLLPYFKGDFWPEIIEKSIKGSKNDVDSRIKLNKAIYKNIEVKRKNFFDIQLLSTERAKELYDPNPLMSSSLMNEYTGFIAFCIKKRFDFASLRRVTFSTMCIMYERHNEKTGPDHAANTSWRAVPVGHHFFMLAALQFSMVSQAHRKASYNHWAQISEAIKNVSLFPSQRIMWSRWNFS